MINTCAVLVGPLSPLTRALVLSSWSSFGLDGSIRLVWNSEVIEWFTKMAPPVNVASTAEFDKHVNGSKLTVVDFYADWCGPCKAIAPRYEALAQIHPEVQFLKVNTDTLGETSAKYGVRAMPTFMFFRNGSKLGEVVGANIGKVEVLVQSLKKNTRGAMPGKGHTLGSGKPVSSSSFLPNIDVRAFVSSSKFVLALFAFMAYLYFSKSQF